MVKVSNFIVGLILVSMIITILGFFMADISQSTGVTYDNTTITAYNKLNEISDTTEDLQKNITRIRETTGVLDVIGSFFSNGYQTILITADSVNFFDSMTNNAIQEADLGASGKVLKTGIMAIVLILIFVGIFLSAIVKWSI